MLLSEATRLMAAVVCRTLSRVFRTVAMSSPCRKRDVSSARDPRRLKADLSYIYLPSAGPLGDKRTTPQCSTGSSLDCHNDPQGCAAACGLDEARRDRARMVRIFCEFPRAINDEQRGNSRRRGGN